MASPAPSLYYPFIIVHGFLSRTNARDPARFNHSTVHYAYTRRFNFAGNYGEKRISRQQSTACLLSVSHDHRFHCTFTL